MALKPGAKDCVVKEQIIEDLVTGLTIQIRKYSDDPGGCQISIHGECLRFGNRDFIFNKDGEITGTGTGTGQVCTPSWLQEVKP